MAKIEVFIFNREHRGKGVDGNPYRLVDQYFTLEGELVVEKDPCEPDSPERKLLNDIVFANDHEQADSLDKLIHDARKLLHEPNP